jgi:protein subunit release factor A
MHPVRSQQEAPVPAPVATAPSPSPAPEVGLPPPAEEKQRTPGQLQRDYWLTREQSDRTEIIYQLGDLESADAIHSLMWLYQAETDLDLKQEILDAVDRIEEQIPAKLALLNVALAPGQPRDLHDTVVEMLLGINDRRAILTWQLLLKDSDPEVRELAQQQIEELQNLDTQ